MRPQSFYQRTHFGRALHHGLVWLLVLAMSDLNARPLIIGSTYRGAEVLHRAHGHGASGLVWRPSSFDTWLGAERWQLGSTRPPFDSERKLQPAEAADRRADPIREPRSIQPSGGLKSAPRSLQLAQVTTDGGSDPSDPACFDLLARPKSRKVQVDWAPVAGALRYDVFRGEDTDPVVFQKVGEAAPNLTTLMDSGVPDERTYLYFVRVVLADGFCDSLVASAHPTARRNPGNYPPVIYSRPVLQGWAGMTYRYHLRATDPYPADPIQYTRVEGPEGLQVDPDSGWVEWLPVPGRHRVTLQADDGRGGTDLQNFDIEVLQPNRPPLADPGPAQVIHVGTAVGLDGSGSSDPDGDPLTFAWTVVVQPPGSAVEMDDPTSPQPGFIPTHLGSYVIQLVVFDGQAASEPVGVEIVAANEAPIARSGSDARVPRNTRVELDGSSSSDPDGDPITFRWSWVARPDGSQAMLDGGTTARPGFVADRRGDYVLELVVNDGFEESAADSVTISVDNTPPVADAGLDRTVKRNAVVELDGSGSTDDEGDALTYRWTLVGRPANSQASLSDATAARPTFTADQHGEYVFELMVNDGLADSAPDRVTISTVNSAPVADAGPDRTAPVLETVTLDGLKSSDPDGDPLSFRWSIVAQPPGSDVRLSDPTTAQPSFRIPVPGDYTFELIVHDGFEDGAADRVTISTVNSRPVARAGEDQEVRAGMRVLLDGSGSSDVDGDPLTFAWSILSVPDPDRPVDLDDPTSVTPSFLAEVVGLHVIQLVVEDGQTNSEPDTVTVKVLPALVAVPDVVGLPQVQAESTVTGATLTVGAISTTRHPTVPAGRVISQEPAAGTLVEPGTAVAMVISLGPPLVAVPDVIGELEADAGQMIVDATLRAGRTVRAYHATVPAGRVFEQAPEAGTLVTPGTEVDLSISLGPEPWCAFSPAEFAQWRTRISPVAEGSVPGTVAPASAPECALILREGDSFEVAAERTFALPAEPGMLVIGYETPTFDAAATGTMRDAFEVALVDGAGRPLTFTIQGGAAVLPADGSKPAPLPASPDALFNHTEGFAPFAAPGAAWTAGASNVVAIDLRDLAPGSNASLILRLVNNDGDRQSQVRILEVAFAAIEPAVNFEGTPGVALSLLAGGPGVEAGSGTGGRAGCEVLASPNLPGAVPKIVEGTKRSPTDPLASPTVAIAGPADQSRQALGTVLLSGFARVGDRPDLPPPTEEVGTLEIYFDEDVSRYPVNGINDVPRPQVPRSLNAAAAFLSRLVAPRTETFESYSLGSRPARLSFGDITAELSGTAIIAEYLDPTDTGDGGFPLSGTHAIGVGGTQQGQDLFFSLRFSSPQSAFGLFGTDVELNQFRLILEGTDGVRRPAPVNVTRPQGSGGAFYFGVIDTIHPFVSAEFQNLNGASDGFVFDDFTIGTPSEVVPLDLDYRITRVTVNGILVDALDPAGNFFARVQVQPGRNLFEVVATDSFGLSTTNAIEVVGTACVENLAALGEVSTSVLPTYGRTSFSDWTEVLDAELALRNTGTESIQGPIYVGVTRISDPNVALLSPDGVTADGVPYYDYSAAMTGAALESGQSTQARTLAFSNPGRMPFTYELVVLGRRNQPPAITTLPAVTAVANRAYGYDVDATDPDADPLGFSLLSGPVGLDLDPQTGVVHWNPIDSDLGTHDVRVRVEDGRGGVAVQQYVLTVTAPPVNRPPYFTSQPVTTASLGSNPPNAQSRFTPGQVFISSSTFAHEIRVYDAETLQFIRAFQHPLLFGTYIPGGLAFNARGNLVCSGNASFVEFFDYGVEYANYPKATAERTENIVFDSAGNLYTTTFTSGSNQLNQYRASDYAFMQTIELPSGAGQLTGITIDSQRRFYIVSQSDGVIHVLQASPSFDRFDYVGFIDVDRTHWMMEGIQVNQNGELILAAEDILRFDPESGRLLGSFDSPDDAWPVPLTVDNRGQIYTADFENGDGTRSADLIRFSPDGVTLVSTNDPNLFGPFGLAISGSILPGTKPASYAYDATAIDPDGNLLSYSFGEAPEGMTVDSRTGQVRWNPRREQMGDHRVSLLASDGNGGVAVQSFVVTTLGAVGNHAPVIVSDPAPRTHPGDSYRYPVVAVDPDGDELQFELAEAPDDMVIDAATGLIEWPIPADATGGFPVRVRVHDGKGGTDEQAFTLEIVPRPDLVVTDLEKAGLQYDPQCLTAHGTISATVSNLGPGTVEVPFRVLFFEDRNLNGVYNLGIDPVLGQSRVESPLGPGVGIKVSAEVAGEVLFPDNLAWAMVDSENDVAEVDEGNNQWRSDVECRSAPVVGQFDPVVEWRKDRFAVRSESDQVMITPMVADLDANGIPDIVFTTFSGYGYTGNGVLRAIAGDGGRELWSAVSWDVHPGSQVALGDIDGDGRPEIVAYSSGGSVMCFEHDGALKWISSAMPRPILYGGPSIADLDGNGQPEVIVGSQVLNSDGALRWDGVAMGGTGQGYGYSAAADLDMDGQLEVVTGNTAYRADGTILWQKTHTDGKVAIGNFDSDDYPEIVMVPLGEVFLLEHDGSVKWGPLTLPTRGGGAPTVADFDGDGRNDIGIAGEGLYVALRGDGTILWTRETEDYSSWSTGSSVFDFDGDGRSEVVYGDERKLWIYDGRDGSTLYRLDERGSGTLSEYPVLVDVDADGNTEIVVAANDYYRGTMRGIVVIGDRNDTWVGTRKIWNQHTYHINNVNDDGTIPRHEEPSWLTHNSYRLNALPTREASLAAPDLITSAVRVSIAANGATVTARIGNGGAVLAASGVRVAFYQGDPSVSRNLLGVSQTSKTLVPGDFEDVSVTLNGASVTDLWIVADDDGTGHGQVRECDEANNLYHPGIGLDPYNRPPTFTSVPITGAREGEAYRYEAQASDPDGDAVSFALRVAPAGMSIDAASGRIAWVPGSDAVGVHPVEVVATDARGARSCQLFSVTVADTINSNPLITSEPPTTADRGRLYRYTPRAVDPDGDTLIFDLVTRPSGMVLEPSSGITLWRPDAGQVGRHDVVLRVRDGRGGVDVQAWSIEVGVGNSAPIITTTAPTPAVVGVTYQYEVTAQDAEGDAITLSLETAPTGMTLESMPAPPVGLPGGSATKVALIRWTPDASQIGDHPVVVLASDARGAESLQSFRLPVVATAPNDAPVFTSSPRLSIRAGLPYVYLATATDRNGDPLTFRWVDGPAGMTLDPAGSALARRLNWTPSPDQMGRHGVGIEVSDGRGGVATQDFEIEVVPSGANRVPVITSTPPPGAVLERVYAYDATAQDEDADPVVWSLVSGPVGMSVDAHRGALRWSPQEDQLGVRTVTLRASDPFGASDDQTFEITVRAANLPPAIVSVPPTEGAVDRPYLYGLRATDPDGDSMTFRATLAPTGATLTPTGQAIPGTSTARLDWTPAANQTGFQTFILEADDGNGGVASQSFVVVVTDEAVNRPPAFTSQPILNARPGVEYRYDLRATDPEAEALTFQLVKGPAGMALGQPRSSFGAPLVWTPDSSQTGTHEVLVVAADPSGAGARQRFAIQVRANQAPVITSDPPLAVDAGSTYRYGVRAVDPDGDRLRYELGAGPAGMSIDAFGQILWATAPDASGNHAVSVVVTDPFGLEATQSFEVQIRPDIQAPVVRLETFASLVDDAGRKVFELGKPARFRATASDNVGVASLRLQVEGQEVVLDSDGYGTVTFAAPGFADAVAIAEDLAGNVAQVTDTVRAVDLTATGHPEIAIESPANDAVVTRPIPVVATITSASPLVSYRVDMAPAGEIDLGDIAAPSAAFTTLTRVDLPAGTSELRSVEVATFDPMMLLNDSYLIRVTATDINNRQRVEGVLVHVQGNLKFGEFRLEFTDLSVPLAGIPITIQRVYDSRLAKRQGDFGYGWSLGLRDARILKIMRNGGMFIGSRVYITGPDRRRNGYTASYLPSSFLFSWLGTVILTPDPGVYDRLEIVDSTAMFTGGQLYEVFSADGYNPSTFRLTTKDGTVYTYHDRDGLQGVVDPNGNRLDYRRDGIFHYPAGASQPDQAIPFVRDAAGRITQILDPDGKVLRYHFDTAGDLRNFTDQESNVTGYFYDDQRAHYLDRVVDPLGRVAIQAKYDDAGRFVALENASGNTVEQSFDPSNNLGTVTDARGNQTLLRYDDRGNEIERIIPGISTNLFAYDANNNLTNAVNARGGITNMTYDARGNVTSITDPSGATTTITYGALDKPQRVVNALGQTLTMQYDTAGHLLEVVNNAGHRTVMTRDGQGRVTSLTDAAGNTTRFEYDGGCACGRPGKIINPDGSFRLYEYTSQGLTNRVVNELGAETRFDYDGVGRLLSTRDALGNETRFFYRGPLLTNIVDALGRSTRYEYDDQNRTNKIIDAEGGVVEFRYDANGNRTHVIDPVGNDTEFVYDSANRLIRQIDPLGHVSRFAYDAAGNRIEAIDRNGRRRTFDYDAMNRMTREQWWEGNHVIRTLEYAFNALGVQTVATDPAAHYEYTYESLNRLTRVAQTQVPGQVDFTLDYTYTPLGQVASVTDNWGVSVGSEYDHRNQLARRTWQGPGIDPARVDFAYDPTGNRVRLDRFADLAGAQRVGHTTTAYNRVGIVTNITHLGPSSEVLAKYDYEFDVAHQIVRWTIDGQPSVFGYDRTGQLTNAVHAAQPNESYRYDANGNRIGEQSTGTYTVGGNNQILSDGTHLYGYDAEGNMTSRSNVVTHTTTEYYFDHRNRLVEVVDREAGGQLTQSVVFEYDANNRRLRKTANGDTMRFLHNQHDAWGDMEKGNIFATRYLLGIGVDQLLARNSNDGNVEWYYADNSQSIRQIRKSDSALLTKVEYDIFGRKVAVFELIRLGRFGYAGRDFDEETRLVFFRARYFSPDLGRFLAQDPIGFEGNDANLYRYVNNNAISLSDPFGTGPIGEFAIALARITAVSLLLAAVTCDLYLVLWKKEPGMAPVQYVEKYATVFVRGYFIGLVVGAFWRAAAVLRFGPGINSFGGGTGADLAGISVGIVDVVWTCGK